MQSIKSQSEVIRSAEPYVRRSAGERVRMVWTYFGGQCAPWALALCAVASGMLSVSSDGTTPSRPWDIWTDQLAGGPMPRLHLWTPPHSSTALSEWHPIFTQRPSVRGFKNGARIVSPSLLYGFFLFCFVFICSTCVTTPHCDNICFIPHAAPSGLDFSLFLPLRCGQVPAAAAGFQS